MFSKRDKSLASPRNGSGLQYMYKLCLPMFHRITVHSVFLALTWKKNIYFTKKVHSETLWLFQNAIVENISDCVGLYTAMKSQPVHWVLFFITDTSIIQSYITPEHDIWRPMAVPHTTISYFVWLMSKVGKILKDTEILTHAHPSCTTWALHFC